LDEEDSRSTMSPDVRDRPAAPKYEGQPVHYVSPCGGIDLLRPEKNNLKELDQRMNSFAQLPDWLVESH